MSIGSNEKKAQKNEMKKLKSFCLKTTILGYAQIITRPTIDLLLNYPY